MDWYNYRLSSLRPQEIIQHLDEIFVDQSTVFKLNVSFGFILRNNETGDLQYYYASRNNEQVFQEPFQIARATDLQQFRQALKNLDVLEWVRQRRPNSKWGVEQVTIVTFFVTKLRGHPIGRGFDLPPYLSKNNGLLPLDRNAQTGKIYNDNLCFFRSLALHNCCHPKNLERDAKHYYEQYRETRPDKKKFCGVKLKELPELEQLYSNSKSTSLTIPSNPPNSMGRKEKTTQRKTTKIPFRSCRAVNLSFSLSLCKHSLHTLERLQQKY